MKHSKGECLCTKKCNVDKNMEQLITEDFKGILIDSSIPFDFIDELEYC